MKPTMAVKEGDRVKLGQVTVFLIREPRGFAIQRPLPVLFQAINRGERRVLQSVVIDVDGNDQEIFSQYSVAEVATLDRAAIVGNLVSSGLWTALRTRPYSKVPAPASDVPSSIFVTAMDTNPLAVDPALVIAEREEDFANGLKVLKRLTDGPVHLCIAGDVKVVGGDVEGVQSPQLLRSSPRWFSGYSYPLHRSG